jgi:hypothetical protein
MLSCCTSNVIVTAHRDATGCIDTGSTAWMTAIVITCVEAIHHNLEKVADMVSQCCSLISSGDDHEIQHHLEVPTLILTCSRRGLQAEDKSDQKTFHSVYCVHIVVHPLKIHISIRTRVESPSLNIQTVYPTHNANPRYAEQSPQSVKTADRGLAPSTTAGTCPIR